MAGLTEFIHAHIYFERASVEKADELRMKLVERFPPTKVRVSRLIDHPIGPHPLPMFEADFRGMDYQEIVAFIDANRDGLDVLVHQLSGDEIWDHTEGARWLGKKLTLNLQFLHDFMAGKVEGVSRKIQSTSEERKSPARSED